MELEYKKKYRYAKRDGSEGRGSLEGQYQKLRTNPLYEEYWKEKQAILERYPPIPEMNPVQYRSWLEEITELMFRADGWYQRWLWDTMSEWNKLVQERKAKGRKPHNKVWNGDIGDWVNDEE